MKTSIRLMYNRLADFLIGNLDFHQVSVILEAGCGRGQLTIPFAKKAIKILTEFKIIAFDVSAGPYEGALNILKECTKRKT